MNARRALPVAALAAAHLLASLLALQTAAAAEMARIEFPAPPTTGGRAVAAAAHVLLFPLGHAAAALGPASSPLLDLLPFAANSLLWSLAAAALLRRARR